MSELQNTTADTHIEAEDSIESISWRAIVLGGLSFLLIVTVLMLVLNALGVERLQQTIADAGPTAPVLYVILKALTNVFAPLSAGPIQISSGVLFGLWPGVFLSLIGEVIGGSMSFWIARLLGRPVVHRFVGKDGMKKVDQFYKNNLGGWKALVYARLFLFTVYDFVSYAAGLAPMSFRTYFTVSLVVGFIPTFLVVWVGATLSQNVPLLMTVFAVGAVLSLLPVLLHQPIKRLLGKRGGKPQVHL